MTNEEVLSKIHNINFDMYQKFDSVCQKYGIKYTFACGSLLGVIRHKGFIPWDNDIDVWMTRDDFKKLLQHKSEFTGDVKLVLPEIDGKDVYFDSVPRLNFVKAYIKMDEEVCKFYSNRNNRIDLDIFFIDKTRDSLGGKLQRTTLSLVYAMLNAYRHPTATANYSGSMKLVSAVMSFFGRMFSIAKLRSWVEKIATRYNNDPKADYYFSSNDTATAINKYLIPERVFDDIIYLEFEDTKAPVPVGYDEVLKIWFGDYMKLPPEEQRIPHWGQTLITPDKFVFEEPPSFE